MQITQDNPTDTSIKLTITADPSELAETKQHVLQELSSTVKPQGFRPGKAPLAIVEKNLDPATLQSEFLQHAVNELYGKAVDEKRLRPATQPQINITKFVPFTTLEFTAEVEAVGDIKLADYKAVKVKKQPVKITEKQIDDVIEDLRQRVAKKAEVKRAAKLGDEVVIDFAGSDTKTKEPIAGADGKDYSLTLGSDSFIPGFEAALVGSKAGDTKELPLTFPKDYRVTDLQNRKVTFAVTVHKVQSLTLPKVDAKFAAQIGPFKTVADLQADVRKELEAQQAREFERQYENELLQTLADKSTMAIPSSMVDEEVERIEQQERQDIAYRGQTWQEHLEAEGLDDAGHKAKTRPAAEQRIKAGLVLGEVAEKENITVTPEELEVRIQLLKGQYADDQAMQAELDKPENRRDILNRLLTEKTLDKLKTFAKS